MDEINLDEEEEQKEDLGEQEGGGESVRIEEPTENPHLSLLQTQPNQTLGGGWDDDEILDF